MHCRERLRTSLENGRDYTGLTLPLEGASSRQHLVDECTKREDVRSSIRVFPMQLFRRHVRQRAENRPFGSERPRRRHRFPGRSGSDDRGRARFREAEVEQLCASPRQHDVRRFEIPMDDAVPMRVIQRVGNLDGIAQDLFGRQRPAQQARRKRFALEILHDEKAEAVLLANVEQGTDVRMTES